MSNVAELIERAASRTGSEYKLAKALGVPQQRVSNWKHGRESCSPADRARLAGFAGEDAVQELVRATLEKHPDGTRGRQLAALLGKLSHQTGGATVTAVRLLASLSCSISAAWSAYSIHCVSRQPETAVTMG